MDSRSAQAAFHENHHIPSREMFDSGDRAEDIEIAIRMRAGMDAVVEGPTYLQQDGRRVLTLPQGGRHETVGEAVVMVVPRVQDNLLAYQVVIHTRAPESSEVRAPGRRVATPNFGSAASGSFTYDVLGPREPEVAALGVYFREGRLGLLYAPLSFDRAETYPSRSIEQFVECVRLRHRINLVGLATAA